jgi:hypothetical protein
MDYGEGMDDSRFPGSGTGLSPAGAAVALAGIEQSTAAVRRSGRWVVRFLIGYAVATVFFVPATGLARGRWSLVVAVAWGVFLLGLLLSVRRHQILRRGFCRLYLSTMAVWTALWITAAVVGAVAFPGSPAFWLPAGLIVAAPLFAAARMAGR